MFRPHDDDDDDDDDYKDSWRSLQLLFSFNVTKSLSISDVMS